MRRSHPIFVLALLFAFAAVISCKSDMQSQIDIIRQGDIASIKEQMTGINTSIKDLEKVDAQLQVYIQQLSDARDRLQTAVDANSAKLAQLDEFNASIQQLQKKDEELQSQITALRTYVDTQLSQEKDWVSATFSTLEQYKATSEEIAGIKTSVTAVNKSLSDLETRLDGKIAGDIASATASLQEQLDAILARLADLESRLSSVEARMEDLFNRIQSISVVPTYTDGTVGVKRTATKIRFEVLPRSASVALAGLGLSAFSLDAVQTQTKSSAFTHLPVMLVQDNGECLEVFFSSDALGDSFFAGANGASARLKISDGNNERASAFFGLTADASAAPDVNLLSEPSNCYIVPSAGIYSFKTVKGNSTETVGEVAKAEVLWESFGNDKKPEVGEIIAQVSYDSGYPGFVIFSTPEELKDGNAVIAVKDAGDNILWSWHIWVSKGYDPVATAQTYYNDAGVMMDRNVGALSATPGDLGAVGLLFQWGRKDPFLAASQLAYPYSSTATREIAASTLSWPSPVKSDSSNGTIGYAVAHPTTFITVGDNMDWYYTGGHTCDHTRWQSEKTIYDPCPSGWRIPDGGSNGVWPKALGSQSDFTYTWDSVKAGMEFSGKLGSADCIWYPAAGYRYMGSGEMVLVGTYGNYWTCSPLGNEISRFSIYYDGRVTQKMSIAPGFATSARCMRE